MHDYSLVVLSIDGSYGAFGIQCHLDNINFSTMVDLQS